MRWAALAGAAALLFTAVASAEQARVALVRPPAPDPVARETLTRLQAELSAAGFTVIVVDAGPGAGDGGHAEGAADPPAATVTLAGSGPGAVLEVWMPDPGSPTMRAHRVDTGANAESSRPAATAIRAVELLRAGLRQRRTATPRARPTDATLDDGADLPDDGAPVRRPRRGRALLEGPTLELGITAIYGLGDTAGRLSPALRFGYGAAMGLAGRLTVLGTSTDQAALAEIAYGFGRSWRAVAPVVSLGAGGCHTHLDDTATPRFPRLRTEAWGGVLSAGGGLAARVTDRAAFLVDAHAFLVETIPGAIVGAAPAGAGPKAMMIASLGVVAGF